MMRKVILGASALLLMASQAFASDLEGAWKTFCIASDDGKSSVLVIWDMKVDGNYVLSQKLFATKDCKEEAKVLMFENKGTYVAGPGVDGNKNIDWVMKDFFLTPAHDQVVADFNKNKYCGAEDWEKDTPKKINGLTCGEQTWPLAAMKFYDLYKVTGTLLRFGKPTKERDGSTPEKRPDTLGAQIYHK